MRTRIGVPLVFVVRANLLAHELLVDDLLEFDHCGCGINGVLIRGGLRYPVGSKKCWCVSGGDGSCVDKFEEVR